MYLVVTLRFAFLFKYFPQNKALCSYFAVRKKRFCSLVQNPQALVWQWWQKFTFKINIPTVNAPASTNKVFVFKLTIEDYFNNHSELIIYILAASPDQICCVFSSTPGILISSKLLITNIATKSSRICRERCNRH